MSDNQVNEVIFLPGCFDGFEGSQPGCDGRHKMPTDIEIYDCDYCGIYMDRDLNAARNIIKAGTASHANKNGTNAFGEIDYMEKIHVLTILADLNEEGSHVLKDVCSSPHQVFLLA